MPAKAKTPVEAWEGLCAKGGIIIPLESPRESLSRSFNSLLALELRLGHIRIARVFKSDELNNFLTHHSLLQNRDECANTSVAGRGASFFSGTTDWRWGRYLPQHHVPSLPKRTSPQVRPWHQANRQSVMALSPEMIPSVSAAKRTTT